MNQEIKATQSVPPRGSESRGLLAAQMGSLHRECRWLRDCKDRLEQQVRERDEEIGCLKTALQAASQRADAAEQKAVEIANAEPVSKEAYRDVLREKLCGHVTARFEHSERHGDRQRPTETLVEFDCDIDTVMVEHDRMFDADLPIPTLVSALVPAGEVDAEVELVLEQVHPMQDCGDGYRSRIAEFAIQIIGPA